MKQAQIRYLPKLDYAATEAINTLCTNITFTGDDVKTIQLTSCRESEGKTLLSVSVWTTLAQMGLKTVLLDADLRRSSVNGKCGVKFMEEPLGLSHYLNKKDIPADDILYETNIPNAFLIPVGREVVNSMQLLSSPRLDELIKGLKEDFDYIIIDTPPVGAIVDAATVAKRCDGTLLVVTQNKTTKEEVLSAKRQIEQAGCPVLGTVLNHVDMKSKSSRYYNSAAYYSAYRSNYYTKTGKKGKK